MQRRSFILDTSFDLFNVNGFIGAIREDETVLLDDNLIGVEDNGLRGFIHFDAYLLGALKGEGFQIRLQRQIIKGGRNVLRQSGKGLLLSGHVAQVTVETEAYANRQIRG